MARTVQQIKQELAETFMADTTLAAKYGFTAGASFEQTFSKVSIENLLLYIVAAAIWTHEKLFDTHRAEVEDIIEQQKPHTLRWYVNKAKLFRMGQPLIAGTDTYDDTGLSEDDINDRRVVRFAAASEANNTVYIKVAGEDSSGHKRVLDNAELNSLGAYLVEVKDAGVRVEVINRPAYVLVLNAVIFYDPLVLDHDGNRLTPVQTGKPVENAITSYIENLPFNGEYSNMALTDVLQQTEGVVIAEIRNALGGADGQHLAEIDVRAVPESGYYTFDKDNSNIEYRPYETVLH